ncbi:molybdopterin-dependent oxidoreductase [Piscinibacter gummiphilus]|uniref:Sulfite oxidase n=1 Tax=Piscinibacter gummiphilus TaxID=946333 RepID=A0A1W6L4J5_9BURK|nr:molybdopterin-dependent oxidoreductase [Piscinibacter gummiphilus]ARN19249.1 sulfite oxidase [Piscinibacter gummiphilus]ATU63915.1 sulfite oxidase [Piscinibacter gummiphilus]GLS93137.1 sulfite oxidase [Piscinibacter gummiphilus]
MTFPTPSLHRRHLLAGSAGALAAAGLGSWSDAALAQAAKPLPEYAAWKDANALIVHTSTTIETKRSAFGSSVITPAEQLYVRNNLPTPPAAIVADRNAWTVSIEGVRNPRALTLAELKTMGIDTVATVLQCSGNGRGFFPHKPSGTPWTVGAAGCVVWSGVPLRAVVEALGGLADPSLAFLTGTGGEKLPDGVDPASVIVERSLPIKALGDALLAWEMNGAPLPLAHGGPLRLVVPGYQGVNNIKYVKRVAFSAKESGAKIMQHGYRMTPMGQKADPSQASVLEMNVKSWINSPSPDGGPVKAGLLQVHGVAFSGTSPVTKVEISVDGGKTWHVTGFVGPDLGRFAWRQFAAQVRVPAGTYTLASRATDAAGNVQPEQRLENVSGYGNNSWADHAVKVTVV